MREGRAMRTHAMVLFTVMRMWLLASYSGWAQPSHD